MKRVLVIGSPGSGKTTFAKKLEKKTGLPLIHLDLYYHDKSKNYYDPANREAWRAHVLELLQPDKWIVDGNYSSSFPERFEMADTILFFDLPLRVRVQGIVKRRIEFSTKKRTDMPDDWKEKISIEFVRHVLTFRRKYHPKITRVLTSDASKKVVTFKSRAEAEQYLADL